MLRIVVVDGFSLDSLFSLPHPVYLGSNPPGLKAVVFPSMELLLCTTSVPPSVAM